VAAALSAGVIALLALPGGSPAAAGPRPGHTPQTAVDGDPDSVPSLTRSTFADPPTSVRPKYRWWQPLAYTDDDELAGELQQIRDAGGGGAEVAPFSVEGAGHNTDPFLETYGWGTPRWAEKVATMLAAAKKRDLSLDLTIGPRWPATVPTVTDVNDPATAKQLAYAVEFDHGGQHRSGALPSNLNVTAPAGAERRLVGVVAARCSASDCATQSAKPRMLEQKTAVDLTDKVTDGKLDHDFPGDADDTYALLAFYQIPTGQSLSGYTATGTNYTLDTLSTAGSKATTDFYDAHILTPKVSTLLRDLRSADLFEDSLEIGSTQKWTGDFVEEWTKRRGYSPLTLLPALAGAGDQGRTSKPDFDFGDGLGARVRTDYRQTWSDLYVANRLDVLRRWAHRHHISTRIQPYGAPIDIANAAAHIDVPEGESLAFGQNTGAYSNVEDYKVVASGAHQSGRAIVSDECCAFAGSVFGSTVGDASSYSNLQAVYRGFAGGVNQVVWHGFPYLSRGPAGAGSQSSWPGMTYGGNTSYSEAFGAKNNPSWSDYRSVNDNLARTQLVLRQGSPRFDLAVYWQDFGLTGTGTTGTGSDSLVGSSSQLAREGYSYEYLSPDQLTSKAARYRAGSLFPDGSGYHAVLLKDQQTMPLAAAERLLQLARQGLPVVVVGKTPSATPGYDPTGRQDARLRGVISRLLAQRDVRRVRDLGSAPEVLRRLGVDPAVSVGSSDGSLLTVRRHTADTDYYFIWNQTGSRVRQTVDLRGSGSAYRLDTWSGEISPLSGARRDRTGVQVPVELAAHDAVVVAVSKRHDTTFRPRTARIGTPGGDPAGPVELADWSLSVDSWTPGKSGLPGDTAHHAVGPVSLRPSADGTLPSWDRITPAGGYDVDLADVSGVGTYTARVDLDRGWQRVSGAWLDLGSAVDTVSVSVNGHSVPVDQLDLARVEVGRYLQSGENLIRVKVASTLLNAVRVAPGTGAAGRAAMAYGMSGPVTLTPHQGAGTYLVVQALQQRLPVARGGTNRAEVTLTNSSARASTVRLSATTAAGVRADLPQQVRVAAGETRAVEVVVHNDSLTSGSTDLRLSARAASGVGGTAVVHLQHSTNLALNADGAPFPAVQATTSQDRCPAFLATDGSTGTFYVSYGRTAGQGPTASDPVHFGVDLGATVSVGSVHVGGRSNYGPRDYVVQTSQDGEHWKDRAQQTDAPKTGATIDFDPVDARYVRVLITKAWDNGTDANVQIDEFGVGAG